jgi:D-xylose transport system substrate-binding protein
MRLKLLALAAVGVIATSAMTACDDSGDSGDSGNSVSTSSGKARIGVILPDTKTSKRWVAEDTRYLQAAFDRAKVPVEIKNAEGDKANFQRIADDMINSGVKVLMITNLDSPTGRAVLQKARSKKIATIDYDRMTLNGGADYYVSFDNEQVGTLQAKALEDCLQGRLPGWPKVTNPVVAELNGSPSDNNATLYKTGYDNILREFYDTAVFTKGPDQSVPDWNSDVAGRIFQQMIEQRPDINGVVAANDGLAGAVIKELTKRGLNGKVPVTGQDATLESLQAILTGDQCMTVFKPTKLEADNAADLATQLFQGKTPVTVEQIKDPESGAYLRYVSQRPIRIDIYTIQKVIDGGGVSYQSLCAGQYAALCKRYRLTAPAG